MDQALNAPISRTRIKVCGLTREADVDAAVAAGVDALGFVLYAPSPRAVSLARAAELARRLPPFVTPVLLFVNATDQGRHRYLRAARIPLGDDAQDFDLVKYAHQYSQAQAILLDAHVDGYGGAGKAFNWSLLPTSVNAHLVLSGGLTPANVTDGIRLVRPRCLSLAVDVSSGVEATRPDGTPLKGVKDAEKIQRFVAAVRAADAPIAPQS